MEPIHVGVFDEHAIFRHGLIVCLREDPQIVIVDDPSDPNLDLALVSPGQRRRYRCPVVVCGSLTAADFERSPNEILGVLPRGTLTPRQLLGAVHAAAAGFRVGLEHSAAHGGLDTRGLTVLQLLADGHDTYQIAATLACSERTVKQIVGEVRDRLGARNRVHAVAEGIRQGLI